MKAGGDWPPAWAVNEWLTANMSRVILQRQCVGLEGGWHSALMGPHSQRTRVGTDIDEG